VHVCFANIVGSSLFYHQGRTLRTASESCRLQSFTAMPRGAVLNDVSTELHIF
jgi:hypothetical protein